VLGKLKDVSSGKSPGQPQLVVEISNLTSTSSFQSLALLRLSIWHMSEAMRVPGKRWVRMVSVIVIVILNQDSTSSRLLPGSSYSC
jgi:hypothetical protein